MEQYLPREQHPTNLFELQVDATSSSYLNETAKWSKFLAIAGFVFCALLIGLGFLTMLTFATDLNGIGMYGAGLGVGFAMIYIIIGVLYFFPCLFLLRFASRMQVALRSNDQNSLVGGFANLKSCFKFMGILTIVILAFWVISIIFAVISATMNSF